MKTVPLILSLLLFPCVTTPHDKAPLNDENIRKLLVGTWVCAPTDQRCYPSRSTYPHDGTLEFVRYKARRVIIVVQKSIGSVLFEPGLTTESEVVAISEGELTLPGQKGQMNYRVKSEGCVSVDRSDFQSAGKVMQIKAVQASCSFPHTKRSVPPWKAFFCGSSFCA